MSDRGQPAGTIVVIGDDDLATEVVSALQASGATVEHLAEPDQEEVHRTVEAGGIETIAVVARKDAFVLRMALLVRSASEEPPLLLTIFDPFMAAQLEAEIANVRITSLADIVAPSLAGPCIDEGATAVSVEGEHPVLLVDGDGDGELAERPVPEMKSHRLEAIVRALFTPHDKSAGLLLFGAIGLVAAFLVETITAVFVLDNSIVDATYGSAKTLVTVDPNLDVDKGPDWYKLFVSLSMLVTLLFAASFTAGLVNRVVERRLTGLFGRRAVPRRDHVVVVGLGQVGIRLCLLLRTCGIPIVAVEQDPDEENIGLARELGLPIVIGRGSDHSLIGRLSLHRARAVAAVTSDDLENISVAMTARGMEEDIRVVLRVGDGDVANETRSLLALGIVCDVHRIAAVLIASMALGGKATGVVCLDDEALLRYPDGSFEPAGIETVSD